MAISKHYQPSPVFDELGEGFYDIVQSAAYPQHRLRFRNQVWADRIGLGELTEAEWIDHFGRFEPLPRNFPHPMALRYHGHQFRTYNPDLGDGRGFLFAQMRDPLSGRLLDLGTKGSGQTPFSRTGDGRLTLKGAVREVLATEMLEMLGVDTSKTFSVIETGEALQRNDEPSPTRSAVLVRLSHGHVRIGSFQRHAAYRDVRRIGKLLDYVARHFYPEITATDVQGKAVLTLEQIVLKTADTCAAWMIAGFVHGVLNTDNLNVTGESFDYGPYRFLPTYDPAFTAAYFDQTGLYAFGRQPEACLWNLEQLASSFLPLWAEGSSRDKLVEALNEFAPAFNEAIIEKFFMRFGLECRHLPADSERDGEFMALVFQFLFESQVGYDQFFFDWFGGELSATRAMTGLAMERYQGELFSKVRGMLSLYSATNAATRQLKHPYFARPKPCSLLIEEVEWIWEAIDQRDDWTRFEKKIEDIRLVKQL